MKIEETNSKHYHHCIFIMIITLYYPTEVRRGKYLGLGVFQLQYFPLVKIWKLLH